MPISTYPVLLKHNTGTVETPVWADLIDIKDFPDLGGAPEMLDTTTMSDSATTAIAGIQKQDALEFTANYDDTDHDTLLALTGEVEFQLWFGATGTGGKFEFTGTLSVYITGAGVNEVVEMKLVIVPSTPIATV